MKLTLLLMVALCCGLSSAKCRFKKSGDWGECTKDGLRSRTDALRANKSDASCPATRNITKVCREDCQYQRRRRASWGECDSNTNTVQVGRSRLDGAGQCPAEVTEVLDCRVQRRFGQTGRKHAAGNRAQRKQQRKQQRRLQRKQRRQERRLTRQKKN